MDINTKASLERLMTNRNLTDDEKKLIEYSETAITKAMNHSTVLAELLLTKQIEISTKEIIDSNKLLAIAENDNSKRMQKLTWALVTVGSLQAIAMLTNLAITYIK